MNLSNNVTSIQAQQTALNSSAVNVANINRTSSDGSSMPSETDLAKEMTNQIMAQSAKEVNVSAIKTADEMFGSLLDIKA